MESKREKEIRDLVLHCAGGHGRGEHAYKLDVEIGLELLAAYDKQKETIRTQVDRLTTDGLHALRIIDEMNAERDTLLGELKKARDEVVALEAQLSELRESIDVAREIYLRSLEFAQAERATAIARAIKLHGYAHHKDWCLYLKEASACDCGLDELCVVPGEAP